MNHNQPVVHRVPASVLRVPMNSYSWSVHESAQIIPWSSIDVNLHVRIQVCANVPLTANTVNLRFLRTANAYGSQQPIQVLVVQAFSINLVHVTIQFYSRKQTRLNIKHQFLLQHVPLVSCHFNAENLQLSLRQAHTTQRQTVPPQTLNRVNAHAAHHVLNLQTPAAKQVHQPFSSNVRVEPL